MHGPPLTLVTVTVTSLRFYRKNTNQGDTVLGDLIGDAEDADETEDVGHRDEAEDLNDAERTGTPEDEEAPVTQTTNHHRVIV